jgi:hypothetical protein
MVSEIQPSSRGGPIVENFNPYAAPEAGVSSQHVASVKDEGRGVWQDGKTLVMVKIARLPSRCVKCNEPTDYRLRRSLSWIHPALYILLISPLIFIIVALIVRKTAKIEVPLCDEHREKRNRIILIGWIIALAGLAVCFTPAFLGEDYAMAILLGIVMILAGLIVGNNSQVVVPKKINDSHVWLSKVCPAYLDQLPWLPDPDEVMRKMKPPSDFDL